MLHATQVLQPSAVGHLAELDPTGLAIAGFLARYRGSTLRDYRTDLSTYLDWCRTNSLPPLQATRPHLELYVRWLEQRGWASSTVARRFGTVALFYRYAVLDELMAKDPAVNVARPQVRRDEQRRTFLTPLEFAIVLDAARQAGPVEHALVGLLGMSGLRVGEACGLDVTSVHVENGYDTLRFIGKGNKPAIVPLPVPVMRAVREVMEGRDVGPLLLNSRGRRMDRAAATRMIRRVARAAHVKTEISPHSLRRTFCTSGLVSGVPLRDMQLAMRHSDPATTALYDMAAGNPDRLASHRVAAFLAGMTG
jgi:integrase/recombinase XerD